MTDDLSWIDHPANLRANAALLRIVAEQLLLHADEIERLRGLLNDEQYIQLKADYNKGHLSHAAWLQEREQKHD